MLSHFMPATPYETRLREAVNDADAFQFDQLQPSPDGIRISVRRDLHSRTRPAASVLPWPLLR